MPTPAIRSRAAAAWGLLFLVGSAALLYDIDTTAHLPALPSATRYGTRAVGMLVVALVALAAAFACRHRRRAAGSLVTIATLIAFVEVFDLYVLVFRFDSSGPGGSLSVTHRHWYDTYVHNNAAGYWEDELSPYSDPALRKQFVIAAVGDSFTWGQGLHGRELRFTDRLEQLLHHRGYGSTRVLNFGKGGTGTVLQNELVIPVVKTVHPDVVLLFYLFNDLEDLTRMIHVDSSPLRGPAERTLLAATPGANFLFWNFVAPAKLASAGAQSFAVWGSNYLDPDSFSAHMAQVRKLIATVREMGAAPAVVILPYPHMWTTLTNQFRDRLYGQVSHAVAETGTPVLSLQMLEKRFTPAEFQVNPTDAHPGPAAHAAIAEETAAWLTGSGLLDHGKRR